MLPLEQQVTNLELSRRLNELGVKQDSLFYYKVNNYISGQVSIDILFDVHPIFEEAEFYSAFSASELLEIIPKYLNDWHFIIEKHPWEYEVRYCDRLDEKRLCSEFDKNLCNALAKMLVHLIENKLIEVLP